MKRIILSVAIIAAAAAIVIGATTAYFSDTETSSGNTISAGTIDLAVNNQNPLQGAVVTINDIKPCEIIKDEEVILKNVGMNDGIADLHIYVGEASEGIDSEPECVEEGKDWDGIDTCCTGTETKNENICTVIDYDYCYDLNNNSECDEGDPQGVLQASEEIYLGILPTKEERKLWLSHHLQGEAGNEYQGDSCTYDIDFTLKQIGYPGVLVLENKDPNDWSVIEDDTWGVLSFDEKKAKFKYSFIGNGLTPNTGYSLIYYADPWPGNNPGALIAQMTTDNNGNVTNSGNVELNLDLPDPADANYPDGAKIWLVLSNDYDGTDTMTAWNPSEYLYEYNLIKYEDTNN